MMRISVELLQRAFSAAQIDSEIF